MKKIALVITFVISFFGFVCAQDFSADMLSRASGQTMQGKINVSDKKVRTEMQGSIIIVRTDKNVMWIVMPSERMYMEQAIDQKMLPKTSEKLDGETQRTFIGPEVIDGRQTKKYKVTYTETGKLMSAYQWIIDSGFPVKMEALDGSWGVEYKNLSFVSQPATLFEVPVGYQKMSMPFGAGGAMPSLKDIMSQTEE